MKFNERFKYLREEVGLTQRDFAKSFNEKFTLNISYPTVSYWETGREPNYDILAKLAQYFNVTTDYLLGLSEYKNEAEQIDTKKEVDSFQGSLLSMPQDIRKKLLRLTNELVWLSSNASQDFLEIINTDLLNYANFLYNCNGIGNYLFFEESDSESDSGCCCFEDDIDEEEQLKLFASFINAYEKLVNSHIQIKDAISNEFEFLKEIQKLNHDLSEGD